MPTHIDANYKSCMIPEYFLSTVLKNGAKFYNRIKKVITIYKLNSRSNGS